MKLEYKIFWYERDKQYVAIVTNSELYKDLSGLGDTPLIAFSHLLFVIENVETND